MTDINEWRTGISYVKPKRIIIRGVEITDLIEHSTFAELVYLMITGTRPTGEQIRMIDAILVSLADHGVHAPSTIAARIAASSGTPLHAAVAAGVLAIGDHHGGALGEAMKIMRQGVDSGQEPGRSAADIVQRAASEGRRLPGFGHPYHVPDPRGVALRQLADALEISGPACMLVDAIAAELSQQLNRTLLQNADGDAAAILVDMGIDPAYGRGFFILARTLGLIAHSVEEETRERPVRMIDFDSVMYDGPLNSL